MSALVAFWIGLAAAQAQVAPGYLEAEDGIVYEFTGGDAGDESRWRPVGRVPLPDHPPGGGGA